jgi:hypothetical protein
MALFFTAGVFVVIASSDVDEHRHILNQPTVVFPLGTGKWVGQNYSIVIPSIGRNEALSTTLNHYSRCPSADRIIVIWDDPENDPPVFQDMNILVQVVTRLESPKDLNNRFNLKGVETADAIFSVDDDALIACEDLEFGFRIWNAMQDNMVGFQARVVVEHNHTALYSGDGKLVPRLGAYSVVLTKCAFMHRKYLDMYTESMDSQIRDHIREQHNCEDIAMSFLIAHHTHVPAIFVKAPIVNLRENGQGISASKTHVSKRSDCIRFFSSLYGYTPVVVGEAVISRISQA